MAKQKVVDAAAVKAAKKAALAEAKLALDVTLNVTAVPHSSGGFLVTEKGEGGNFKEYLSEIDPTVKQ